MNRLLEGEIDINQQSVGATLNLMSLLDSFNWQKNWMELSDSEEAATVAYIQSASTLGRTGLQSGFGQLMQQLISSKTLPPKSGKIMGMRVAYLSSLYRLILPDRVMNLRLIGTHGLRMTVRDITLHLDTNDVETPLNVP